MRIGAILLFAVAGCTVSVAPSPPSVPAIDTVDQDGPPLVSSPPLQPCPATIIPPQGFRTIKEIAKWATATENSRRICAERHQRLIDWVQRNVQ
jgi:hypothetical protein